jgi:dynein heavy chain
MEAEVIKEEINKKIMMIDKKQFMALRSYRVPPKEITTMMGAISVIMSNFEKKPLESVPTQWDFYKKKLNDVKLLKTLQSLPKKLETTQFSEKILTLLTPFINDPDIEPSYMEKKISSTCACFCHFIINMYKLDDLLKTKLIPLTKQSEEATQAFTIAQENLMKIKNNLQEIQDKLDSLTENYNKINLEQEKLQAQIAESQKKLTRAQKLTSKLGGEKKRWGESADSLEEKKQFIFGDVILASIYIIFLGPFLVPFREKFVREFIFKFLNDKKIKFSEISEINKIIGDPYLISNWVINGLPPDSGSVDNGIILSETTKPCLFIDPQKQAFKFFYKMYKNDFVIYKKTEIDTKKMKLDQVKEGLLETCIKNGRTLIFDYISYDIPPDAELLFSSEKIQRKDGK